MQPLTAPRAIIQEIRATAAAFVASLDDERRARVCRSNTSVDRKDWHYFPRDDRPGLNLADMDDTQREAALALLRSALSERGLWKARRIMELEEIVRELEGSDEYDPLHYGFVVFGDPRGDEPWGWRAEGHHLSLTVFIGDAGEISVTPCFFGANPAIVHDGPKKGLKTLSEEMDLAFALVQGLEGDQRAKAVISERPPKDILTGPGREAALRGAPEGLPLAELNEVRRTHLLDLVKVYAGRLKPDIAQREFARLRDAGAEDLHFAWAGSLEPGRPHYYRLHGPTLIIEYDNTQDGANHVHTVWHDPRGDFGEDPLKRHYARGHGPHGDH